MSDAFRFTERASIRALASDHDDVRWRTHWKVLKYYAGEERGGKPYDVIEGDGNLLVTTGAALLLDLLIGAGGTVFSNANAYLGVGDSTTAEDVSQTDLQASSNKLRKAMDATFPSRSGNILTWQATFGSGDANFVWNEWAIFNDPTAGDMLNRKVRNLGTKTSASAYVLQVTTAIN